MIKYKYGYYADKQISEIKEILRKKIFFFILCVDPKTKHEYDNVNVEKALNGLLYELGGLNSLLNEPPALVRVMSLLEAARIEYLSPDFSTENWNRCTFRKLVLDAGSELENIKEV